MVRTFAFVAALAELLLLASSEAAASSSVSPEYYASELAGRLDRLDTQQPAGDIHTIGASHLKVMTFYGGTADQLHSIGVNTLRSNAAACTNSTITGDFKMKVLLGLAGDIFDRPKHKLYANWTAATDAFIASAKPLMGGSCAVGVFLGDEIVCGGTPLKYLDQVSARLKASLPNAWIYTNECSGTESTGCSPLGCPSAHNRWLALRDGALASSSGGPRRRAGGAGRHLRRLL
jgi:hypothetical protein